MGKTIFITIAVLILVSPLNVIAAESTPSQSVIKAGDNASTPGPDAWFTGKVRIDPLFPADESVNASGAYVTFEPGARSAWHEHPAGQTLVVLYGLGRTGTADGRVWELRPGDVVRCPPNVRHWHGASPGMGMTHMAITGVKDGKNAIWHDKVTDAEYNRPDTKE